ncbi:MAG: winged helix-turn-helix transcriptional regulator [Candidatus Sericytochromatia bacterium]|nr:winged helix-turn-helix transcriptional regulator [Candidatus Sericytochromatia bacterium]
MSQDALNCCLPEQARPPAFPAGLGAAAALFKALGDEVRLKLLHLVSNQEVCVCDLVDVLDMAQGTLSHHLGVLQGAGLVTARKQGRWNYYRATDLARQPLAALHPAAESAGSVPA